MSAKPILKRVFKGSIPNPAVVEMYPGGLPLVGFKREILRIQRPYLCEILIIFLTILNYLNKIDRYFRQKTYICLKYHTIELKTPHTTTYQR